MKKSLLITLCLTLILSILCGCSKKDTSSDNSATSDVTASIGDTTEVDGVTLTSYKNIGVDWTSTSNSSLLEDALSEVTPNVKKITDRAVKNGDTANIDYTGYKNGIKFEGGEAQGYDLEIGSGSFIDGFEEGLIGVMPGETKNLNLTFPENYGSADLAGKAVVFKVKVNYIAEKEYSDEDKLTAKQTVFKSSLVNHVVENSKVAKLPEKSVDTYITKFRELYTQTAASYGYDSIDAYLTAVGQTKESFEEALKTNAELQVKTELVINAIAKKEDISLTTSEYDTAVKNYASTYSTTESEFVEANGKEYIETVLLQEKVATFLAQNSECK